MKKKIFSVFLACFIFVSSSLYSYADSRVQSRFIDGGLISAPIVATVITLGVGAGILIKEDKNLIDMGRIFYNYIQNNNALTLETVKLAFESSVLLNSSTGKVSVGSDFLDIVKSFFDTTFKGSSSIPFNDIGVPIGYTNAIAIDTSSRESINFMLGSLHLAGTYSSSRNGFNFYNGYYALNGTKINQTGFGLGGDVTYFWWNLANSRIHWTSTSPISEGYHGTIDVKSLFGSVAVGEFPYSGGYDWNKVKDKINDGIYVPGNLSDLVNKDNVWDKDYSTTDGTVTFPGVSNPSIELDNTITFPLDDVVDTPTDTPTDTIWDLVKAFVISLVVPADSFWTDTFGGLRGSFESAFPMVDMSNFNSLVVGGKPFPNIYVTVFGAKCKVVNGDVINSIAEWLRPLIAGFMMLCLMLFNYRKIYKLIRNTEPFGSIATGTSEFRTGMSAPSMSEGFSNLDMARDQLRDVAFDMRNDILSRKNKDI